MSQDDGHGHDQVALHHMQVAMTYAARIHADLDFTTLGWQHFDLFETEWSPCFIEHCCLNLHSALLLYLLWYHSGTTVTAHVSNVCSKQNITRHGIISDKDRGCPYSPSCTTMLLRPPYGPACAFKQKPTVSRARKLVAVPAT